MTSSLDRLGQGKSSDVDSPTQNPEKATPCFTSPLVTSLDETNPPPSPHPEKATGGVSGLVSAARRAEAFLNLFNLAPPEYPHELAKFKAFSSKISDELHAAIAKAEGETP